MPDRESRKIIKVGNSLAVTMPKPWLRYYNLSDKDTVTVLSNGKLTIEPERKSHNVTLVEKMSLQELVDLEFNLWVLLDNYREWTIQQLHDFVEDCIPPDFKRRPKEQREETPP